MEIPDVGLWRVDFTYNLYVRMVTFQPGSSRWISELQSVEFQTGIWRRFQHFCSAMISNEWHDFD